MTGISRFFMLLLCTVVVMICFPDFGEAGWTFAATIVLVWTGIILIMGIVGSLFGLYRFGGINRFLTFVLFLGIMISLLWYLPQDSKVSPINQLKYGQIPTGDDLHRGIQKFTFNFAFGMRNVRDQENFINQKDPKEIAQEAVKKVKKQVKRKASPKKDSEETLDIVFENN